MIVVLSLSMVIFLARPKIVQPDVFQLDAEIFGDHLAAGQDGDIFQHGLAAIAESGRLHRSDGQRAAQLVDHQGRQRFAFDVFGNDQQRTAATWPSAPAAAAGPSSS